MFTHKFYSVPAEVPKIWRGPNEMEGLLNEYFFPKYGSYKERILSKSREGVTCQTPLTPRFRRPCSQILLVTTSTSCKTCNKTSHIRQRRIKTYHHQIANFRNDMHYAVWQYGLWSFQTGGTKLERFLHKNQHTQWKLLNFENWISGGLRSFQKSEFYKSIIFILPFT